MLAREGPGIKKNTIVAKLHFERNNLRKSLLISSETLILRLQRKGEGEEGNLCQQIQNLELCFFELL